MKHWKQIPFFHAENENYNTTVAIIIPARNEAENILTLLKNIIQQSYNLAVVEIFVIDDDSEDATYQLVDQFKAAHQTINLHLYRLKELCTDEKIVAHKKTAIEKAIALSNAELIITTDADVAPSKNWIKTIVQFYNEKKMEAIAAPVLLCNEKNIGQQFQALDFCGMQIITAASLQAKMYNMANGANFAFTKKVSRQ
ncbi:MAG: glycosyltransferase [Chitinophagales bacterium]